MSTKMKTADEWRAEFYAALAADRAERKAWEAARDKERAEEKAAHEAREAAREKERAEEKAAREARAAAWEKEHGEWLAERKQQSKEHEGMKDTLGLIAEGVFRTNFAALMARFKILLRVKDIHTRVRKNNSSGEYDIVGVNGDTVVLTEVKARLAVDDVWALHGKFARFRAEHWHWGKRALVGVVAGLAVNRDAAALARKLGFIVLRLNGAEIHDHTPKGFKLRKY